MCGRFTLKTPAGEITSEFNVHGTTLELWPRFNIAPTQDVLVILRGENDRDEARFFRWGLVPFWAKDPAIGNRMINVRAETVREKPAFRTAFSKRRCLVVADGFYEWKTGPGGKQPFYVRRRDGRPFGFAGIWERWGPKASPLPACAILPTDPNSLMRNLHDRMPVIVPRDAYATWLDSTSPTDSCTGLLGPCDDADLEAYAVSTMVNSPRNDRAECLAPLDPDAPLA
jgi:putative SOS response-associated peptidase YedK